jgi:hypothetical protein
MNKKTITLIMIGIAILSIVTSLLVMQKNRYTIATSDKGAFYKLDKFSGKVWMLKGENLYPVSNKDSDEIDDLWDTSKITGRAGLRGSSNLFQGTLYNGTKKNLTEITVTITATETPVTGTNDTVRWQRDFRDEIFIGALQTGTFQVEVMDADGADLSWQVENIKGYSTEEEYSF